MSNQPAMTILIVDDSATTRAMIKRVIGMTSLNVGPLLEAAHGKAALEILNSTPVHLVLADLNMPVMEGMEMISIMRRTESLRAIPIIVISAQPDPLQIEQLKREGVISFLAKPFTAEGMSSVIGPLLDCKPPVAPPPARPAESFNLTLAEALVEALQTMAFISPELPDKNAPPMPATDLRVVHVGFHGDGVEGSLAIAASAKFVEHMADNCGAADAAGDADDALKELANVTCGLLLRKRLGGADGFKMAPPVMGRPEEMERWGAGEDSLAVSADGFLVTAHVTAQASIAWAEDARR
jgi:CheY-like chemotaxis protein